MKWKEYLKRRHNIAIIGIDNGVTGAVAIKSTDYENFFPTPVYRDRNYTKKESTVTRVNGPLLYEHLALACACSHKVFILLERPLVNPRGFFTATMSAVRCLEAQLVVFEMLQREYMNVYYRYIDSKEWQSAMVPRAKGTEQLKEASTVRAFMEYPQYSSVLHTQDGDALCILQYMIDRKKWITSSPWRVPGQLKMEDIKEIYE